jgi:hypothetical protein
MVLPAHFLYIKKVGTLFFGRTQGEGTEKVSNYLYLSKYCYKLD